MYRFCRPPLWTPFSLFRERSHVNAAIWALLPVFALSCPVPIEQKPHKMLEYPKSCASASSATPAVVGLFYKVEKSGSNGILGGI